MGGKGKKRPKKKKTAEGKTRKCEKEERGGVIPLQR